jgi:hypothetical protein
MAKEDVVGTAVLALLVTAGIYVYAPDHTHHNDIDHWFRVEPDAGYVWKYPNSIWDKTVVWKPGLSYRGIIASTNQGRWDLLDSYNWAYPNNEKSLDVVWTPGIPSRIHPHVVSHSEENQFVPAPGYGWVDATRRPFETVWQPWSTHPTIAHLKAAEQEGLWIPDIGYHWVAGKVERDLSPPFVTTESEPKVQWVEGIGYLLVAGALKDCSIDQPDAGFLKKAGTLACQMIREDQLNKAKRAFLVP